MAERLRHGMTPTERVNAINETEVSLRIAYAYAEPEMIVSVSRRLVDAEEQLRTGELSQRGYSSRKNGLLKLVIDADRKGALANGTRLDDQEDDDVLVMPSGRRVPLPSNIEVDPHILEALVQGFELAHAERNGGISREGRVDAFVAGKEPIDPNVLSKMYHLAEIVRD